MEKQSSLAFIEREPHPPLLREAIKVTIKNGRLVLFTSFIMFSYYALMGLADHLVLEPALTNLVADFATKNGTFTSDPTFYKDIFKDLRIIFAYRFVVWSFLCLVLIFCAAASVYSTYEAYTAKAISLEEMLVGTKGKFKRPLVTTIWMILISLASASFLFFTIGVIGIMTEGSLFTALSSTVLILGALYYVFIFVLGLLSLVVSVLEENLWGLNAIYRASDIMKGKKLRGFAYMMLLVLISAAMHKVFSAVQDVATSNKPGLISLAISIPRIWSYCLMKLLVFTVYTLFYHECKKFHEVVEDPKPYFPVSVVAEV